MKIGAGLAAAIAMLALAAFVIAWRKKPIETTSVRVQEPAFRLVSPSDRPDVIQPVTEGIRF